MKHITATTKIHPAMKGSLNNSPRRHQHYGTFIKRNTEPNLRLSNSLFRAKANHKISWIIHVFDY
jgi:hypothetical protein